MPRPAKGYFYRRHAGKHYALDNPTAVKRGYELYYCIQVHGHRHAVCMHTADPATARRRARHFPRGIDLDDDMRFLKALARAGRWADAQLARRIDH